jgi:hypothetical protein
MGKNYLFSKNGKSIKFIPEHFSPTGGDIDAGLYLRLLANNNPADTFYIVGRSEFSKLSPKQRSELFDYDNVINCWEELPKSPSEEIVTNFLVNYFKRHQVDITASIMCIGQIGTVTIPHKTKQLKHPELTAAVIEMTRNYSTPINVFHNDNLDIPVIEICNDPRYVLDQARDILFTPKASLSQYNEEYIRRHIKSYSDQTLIYTAVQQTYSEMERIFQYRREVPKIDIKNRTDHFSIVLNEGKPSRYPMLDNWILKHNKEVKIIGEWNEKYTKNDSRFIGTIKQEVVLKMFEKVRCTFIIPIKPGWITAKYIEMIHIGVIPFFHPSYDDQNHLAVPEFLRPQTVEELQKRIELLKDDSIYEKLIAKLQKQFCTSEYYDGSKLNNIIMSAVDKNYTAVDLTTFDKTEIEEYSLDNFF